jgi:hypothetical protein
MQQDEQRLQSEDGRRGEAGEAAVGPGGGGGDPSNPPGVMKKPDPLDKTADQLFDEKVFSTMKLLINSEMETEKSNRMDVSPMWRVVQITRLMTPLLDEQVPPPPLPDTPMPIVEPEPEADV